MPRRSKPGPQHTGLYHAREARGMSRSELVRRSGISKQQLSRLENGVIRLRLDHLKPFAAHLGYTPEQMLLWGRFPGTEDDSARQTTSTHKELAQPSSHGVPELDTRGSTSAAGKRSVRKDGRHSDPLKSERWVFPDSFVREQLHTSAERLLVIQTDGDSMAPTIASGERVIVDVDHRTPSPDGLYAIRDPFGAVIVRRLHVLRSSRPTRVKVISDNPSHPSEETPLDEIDIFGKVLCCLKLL
jgi:phage repressor protein C with HTH and peptisase S24 domain/DNA-binding Xre family transcriptional regulator